MPAKAVVRVFVKGTFTHTLLRCASRTQEAFLPAQSNNAQRVCVWTGYKTPCGDSARSEWNSQRESQKSLLGDVIQHHTARYCGARFTNECLNGDPVQYKMWLRACGPLMYFSFSVFFSLTPQTQNCRATDVVEYVKSVFALRMGVRT